MKASIFVLKTILMKTLVGRLLGGLVEEVEHAFSNELLKCTPGREGIQIILYNSILQHFTNN